MHMLYYNLLESSQVRCEPGMLGLYGLHALGSEVEGDINNNLNPLQVSF